MDPLPVPVEALLSAFFGWLLTQGIAGRLSEAWRARLPAIAIVASSLLALGYEAAMVAIAGMPLSWSTIGVALSAGSLAILGHAGQSMLLGSKAEVEG